VRFEVLPLVILKRIERRFIAREPRSFNKNESSFSRHSCLSEAVPDLQKCVQQPEPESSCSRDIVDQPKVSAWKKSAGGGQIGVQVPEGFVVPSHRPRV